MGKKLNRKIKKRETRLEEMARKADEFWLLLHMSIWTKFVLRLKVWIYKLIHKI